MERPKFVQPSYDRVNLPLVSQKADEARLKHKGHTVMADHRSNEVWLYEHNTGKAMMYWGACKLPTKK